MDSCTFQIFLGPRKIKHPSEYVKVGEELEVKVMELDVENRRLAIEPQAP